MDQRKLHKLENDYITDDERIAFLEQLLENEESLNGLASLELVEMPAYLEEEILEAVLDCEKEDRAAAEEQVIRQTAGRIRRHYRPPKWLQLFSYSVKITFAAACAVIALFRMPDIPVMDNREQIAWEREQETLAREAEAEKRQQEVLAQQEKRRRKNSTDDSFVADALQFISSKIFVGGIEND